MSSLLLRWGLYRLDSVQLAAAAALLLWVAHVCVHFARKIPQGDEYDLLLSQEALFRTGVAQYRLGCCDPIQLASFHAPLWWIVGQPFIRLGLGTLGGVLALNLAAAVTTILGTWYLGLRAAVLEGARAPARVAVVSVALLCTLPLFQVSPGIVDIDNGLLTAAMTVYLALLFSPWMTTARARIAVLGAGLAICFLAKLTTPLILIPATGAWLIQMSKSRRHAVVELLAIVTAGAAVFVVVYASSRQMFAWDWTGPIRHNLAMFGEKKPSGLNRIRSLAELLVWLGAPAMVFLGAKATALVRQRTESSLCSWILLLYVFGIWSVYSYLGVTFNLRYFVPSLPVLAVLLGLYLERRHFFLSKSARTWPAAAAAAVGLVVAWCLLPDPYFFIKVRLRYELWRNLAFYLGRLGVLSLALYAMLSWARRRHGCIRSMAGVWLVGAWLVLNVNTSLKQMTGGYQLSYGYGLQSDKDTVSWVRMHVARGAPIVGKESLLWLLRGDGHLLFALHDPNYQQDMEGYLGEGEAYYLIVPVHFGNRLEDGARLAAALREGEALYRNDDYLIVKKRFRKGGTSF